MQQNFSSSNKTISLTRTLSDDTRLQDYNLTFDQKRPKIYKHLKFRKIGSGVFPSHELRQSLFIFLFGLSLRRHRRDGLLHRLLVSQEFHGLDRLEVVIQLVVERDAGRQVDAHDLLVGHVVQVFHDASERIAMGSNEYLFAL